MQALFNLGTFPNGDFCVLTKSSSGHTPQNRSPDVTIPMYRRVAICVTGPSYMQHCLFFMLTNG